MAILEVTSKQFQDNQVDAGKQIILTRRMKKSYTFTPIDDDDLYFSPEMIKKFL